VSGCVSPGKRSLARAAGIAAGSCRPWRRMSLDAVEAYNAAGHPAAAARRAVAAGLRGADFRESE
jgi:hypothetical protein